MKKFYVKLLDTIALLFSAVVIIALCLEVIYLYSLTDYQKILQTVFVIIFSTMFIFAWTLMRME